MVSSVFSMVLLQFSMAFINLSPVFFGFLSGSSFFPRLCFNFRGLPRFCNVFLQFSMAFIDFPLFGSVSMFSMVYPWCCSCHLAGASARSLGRHLAGSSIVSRVPPGAILLLWYIYIYILIFIFIFILVYIYIHTHYSTGTPHFWYTRA